jgi:hypothetical protein
MIRRTFLTMAALAVTCVAFGSEAKASMIVGSLSLNAGAPTIIAPDPSNLGTATQIRFNAGGVNKLTINASTGNYSTVTGTYTASILNLANLSAFTLTSDGGFGNFQATSGVVTMQNGTFLNIELLGTYTGLGAFDPTLTSLSITITKTGNLLAGGAVLTSPPVPEPSTIAGVGVALLGLAGLRRFRRRSA